MSIKENNKLIAEFMGWEQRYENTYIDLEGKGVRVSSMCFDTSWNELMPVIKKINELILEDGYGFKCEIKPFIHDNNKLHLWVYSEHPEDFSNDGCEVWWHGDTPYKSVIQFIKWYNKQLIEELVCLK